jgi:hypothetical protein
MGGGMKAILAVAVKFNSCVRFFFWVFTLTWPFRHGSLDLYPCESFDGWVVFT